MLASVFSSCFLPAQCVANRPNVCGPAALAEGRRIGNQRCRLELYGLRRTSPSPFACHVHLLGQHVCMRVCFRIF